MLYRDNAVRIFIFALLATTSLNCFSMTEIQAIRSAKIYISSQLKDPRSAQFQKIKTRYSMKNGEKNYYAVCGEINAKNSFGGYVGFMPFYYLAGDDGYGKIINPDALDLTDEFDQIKLETDVGFMKIVCGFK